MMKHKAGYGDREWEQFIWSGQERLSEVTVEQRPGGREWVLQPPGEERPGKENSKEGPEWETA